MRLMAGGFGLCGNAEHCIAAIARRGVKDLTIISNNCGNQGQGLAVLLKHRQVAKVICSFIGGNPDLAEQYAAGTVEVELSPQGTLAERIRAGGAGIGGFYTPTGVGTVVAEGKEVRELDGRRYVLERPLRADCAIVRAAVGDPDGNLRFYRTARNFNPLMAMAADVTVAEVDQLVGARRARSRRRPPARDLRAPHLRGARAPRTSSSTGPRAREERPTCGMSWSRTTWSGARPPSCSPARWSTWASACRPRSPTTSRPTAA